MNPTTTFADLCCFKLDLEECVALVDVGSMKFARSALNSARYFWAKLDAPARAEGLLLRSRWALPCFVSDESREDSTGRRKPACVTMALSPPLRR